MGGGAEGVQMMVGWGVSSTYCRAHTRTGSLGTCRSLDMGQGTRPPQPPPHTACGYYTWDREGERERERLFANLFNPIDATLKTHEYK